ncbi:MAG: hypothetical protein K8F30_13885 [Taibaiella sp.]|nr:hypothetical protein [Taibaiella sp.]
MAFFRSSTYPKAMIAMDHHGIRNVNDTLGKMVYDYYFPPGKRKRNKVD